MSTPEEEEGKQRRGKEYLEMVSGRKDGPEKDSTKELLEKASGKRELKEELRELKLENGWGRAAERELVRDFREMEGAIEDRAMGCVSFGAEEKRAGIADTEFVEGIEAAEGVVGKGLAFGLLKRDSEGDVGKGEVEGEDKKKVENINGDERERGIGAMDILGEGGGIRTARASGGGAARKQGALTKFSGDDVWVKGRDEGGEVNLEDEATIQEKVSRAAGESEVKVNRVEDGVEHNKDGAWKKEWVESRGKDEGLKERGFEERQEVPETWETENRNVGDEEGVQVREELTGKERSGGREGKDEIEGITPVRHPSTGLTRNPRAPTTRLRGRHCDQCDFIYCTNTNLIMHIFSSKYICVGKENCLFSACTIDQLGVRIF